ncbi:hypothetical protein ACIBTP_18045 [Streptomyces avidinii]|uniref:hypothetical protein n=1 Tax=Streptomyces avidinii TaxID=1895 RepID=UPI0037A59A15
MAHVRQLLADPVDVRVLLIVMVVMVVRVRGVGLGVTLVLCPDQDVRAGHAEGSAARPYAAPPPRRKPARRGHRHPERSRTAPGSTLIHASEENRFSGMSTRTGRNAEPVRPPAPVAKVSEYRSADTISAMSLPADSASAVRSSAESSSRDASSTDQATKPSGARCTDPCASAARSRICSSARRPGA